MAMETAAGFCLKFWKFRAVRRFFISINFDKPRYKILVDILLLYWPM